MKFLIADDELLVRITVMKALNDLGIQNQDIYQADCGMKMRTILKETLIDIAFVDIKMPDITGLDAIKGCLSLAPSTAFYVLTGYGTFEYAREAIRLGVKDFLLKPLDTQILASIMDKEQAFIEFKNSNIRDSYATKIKSILLKESCTEGFQDLFCLPCICTCDDGVFPDLENLYQAESMYSTIKTVIIPKTDCSYIAFCTASLQYTGAILSDIRSLLEQCLTKQESTGCSLFCINRFVPISEVGAAFASLEHYAVIRVTHGLNRVYTYNEKFDCNRAHENQLSDLLSTFQKNYTEGRYLECVETGRKFLAEMERVHIYENKTQLQNLNQYLALTFPTLPRRLYVPADFSAYFRELSESLLDSTKAEELDIEHVLSYIQQHFAEDISINALASEFHISPNYLSSRFRRETDIRFTDYLTNLRMARAVQLLTETNLQVKEIAASVGYYTASHFIRTFVKAKGITPAEYRGQMKKEK